LTHSSSKDTHPDKPDEPKRADDHGGESHGLARIKSDFEGMKLIPWRDVWTSLGIARIRGNGEMIEVFYDTLFKEAVFDDRGAWSIEIKKPH